MSKHTPGPWTISRKRTAGADIFGDGLDVAFVYRQSGVAKTNARLIAAAPEMVDMLETWGEMGSTDELPRRIRDLAHQTRMLLARIEGNELYSESA